MDDQEVLKIWHSTPIGSPMTADELVIAFAHRLFEAWMAQQEPVETLNYIADLFHIGSEARTPSTILTNITNTIRRDSCLGAVERIFFTKLVDEEGERVEECALNWGASPAEYVEQFRAALADLHPTPVAKPAAQADGVIIRRDRLPRLLELVREACRVALQNCNERDYEVFHAIRCELELASAPNAADQEVKFNGGAPEMEVPSSTLGVPVSAAPDIERDAKRWQTIELLWFAGQVTLDCDDNGMFRIDYAGAETADAVWTGIDQEGAVDAAIEAIEKGGKA